MEQISKEDQPRDLQTLCRLTNKKNPKPEDLAELRKALDGKPKVVELVGDVSLLIFESIIEKLSGDSAYQREVVTRHAAQMKKELGYDHSSFLEKMLINEVMMRWLRLQAMEHDHKSATYREHRFAEGIYYDKRLHFAQRRYLKAVQMLADVRKTLAQTSLWEAKTIEKLTLKPDENEVKKLVAIKNV